MRVNDDLLEPGAAGEERGDNSAGLDATTREFCQRCQSLSAVGFFSPIWRRVAGRHWEHSILCVRCFAALGDEKHIRWEVGMIFYPVSYATHHARRAEVNAPVHRGGSDLSALGRAMEGSRAGEEPPRCEAHGATSCSVCYWADQKYRDERAKYVPAIDHAQFGARILEALRYGQVLLSPDVVTGLEAIAAAIDADAGRDAEAAYQQGWDNGLDELAGRLDLLRQDGTLSDEAEAALRSLCGREGAPAGGWQPIETAPADTLVVVGWREDDDTDPERHQFDIKEEGGVWCVWAEGVEHAELCAPPGSVMPGDTEPYTHWLEVPPLPGYGNGSDS